MHMPVMLQGDAPLRLFQGAAAGAVVTMVIGFGWGGWMLGGTATRMVDQASTAAVTAALAPICVEKFQRAANSVQNLAELKKTVSYQQGTFVAQGGWATLASSEANYAVAQACATTLSNLK